MEGDRTPNEQPTNRLHLAPEDLDRIAAAIRDGLGKKPPDGRKLLWDVVRVLGAFGLLVLVYFVLTHWRPAVDISVRANALSTPQVLTHGSEEGDVAFSVGTGQLRALTVEEVRTAEQSEGDPFMISLPIPLAECDEVAEALDAACDDDVIDVQAPVTVAWTNPQVLQLERVTAAEQTPSAPDPAPQIKLDLKQPSASPVSMTGQEDNAPAEQSEAASSASSTSSQPELTIADRQAASQRWCFTYQPAGGTTALSISGGTGYERTFESATAPTTDCDAVTVQLRVTPSSAAETQAAGSQGESTSSDAAADGGSDESPRGPSVVTLSGISSLNVTTESRLLSASALTGLMSLLQDVRVVDSATPADFTADEPITSGLEIQAGTPSLTIDGTDVTNIDTGSGNLVTTLWQRHSELILPIFIGVVGVFTPLLGTVYRNGVDYLANHRLPNRKAKRDQ